MRIAHLIDSLYWGGAQKLLVTFAAAARERGLRPTIISLRYDARTPIPEELTALGAEVVTFASGRLLDPVRLWRLVRYLRSERFDVLHTHLTYAHIMGALASGPARVPMVSTQHNVQVDSRLYHPIRYALETWALRHRARRVLAVGYVVAEANRARLAGRPMDVVMNAVSPAPKLSYVERTTLRAEMTGNPARPLLISVGRLAPAKGYSDLLKAFAELRQTHPRAALAIVGEGSSRTPLQAQIAETGLQGDAVLLGARNDVPRLLASADIYVSASHWEGLPVAVLEAMAAGLPVVATGVGDVPRVVSPETGIVVPPQQPAAFARALRELMDDPERLSAQGAAAQAYVAEHHSPAAWLDALLAVYTHPDRPVRLEGKPRSLSTLNQSSDTR